MRADDLAAIAAVGDQKAKADQYKAALEQAVAQGDAEACRQFVDHGGSQHLIKASFARGGDQRISSGARGSTRREGRDTRAAAPAPAQCFPTRCLWCSAASCCFSLPRA